MTTLNTILDSEVIVLIKYKNKLSALILITSLWKRNNKKEKIRKIKMVSVVKIVVNATKKEYCQDFSLQKMTFG